MLTYCFISISITVEINRGEEMNPRYVAYLTTTDDPKNWDYMYFIAIMKGLYNKSKNRCKEASIIDHDDFTRFIEEEVKR